MERSEVDLMRELRIPFSFSFHIDTTRARTPSLFNNGRNGDINNIHAGPARCQDIRGNIFE